MRFCSEQLQLLIEHKRMPRVKSHAAKKVPKSKLVIKKAKKKTKAPLRKSKGKPFKTTA